MNFIFKAYGRLWFHTFAVDLLKIWTRCRLVRMAIPLCSTLILEAEAQHEIVLAESAKASEASEASLIGCSSNQEFSHRSSANQPAIDAAVAAVESF
jgi:hypothetical protein